jgi:hypothetical protein
MSNFNSLPEAQLEMATGMRSTASSATTGRSFWEDILPGEVRRGPAQGLVLDLKRPLVPAQRRELPAFPARQTLPPRGGMSYRSSTNQ